MHARHRPEKGAAPGKDAALTDYNLLSTQIERETATHTGWFRVDEEPLRIIGRNYDRACDARNATAAYVMLCRKANLRRDDTFTDSLANMARDLHCAYRDAQKALALLEAIELVKIERRKVPGTKENAPSRYTLIRVKPANGEGSIRGVSTYQASEGPRKDRVHSDSRSFTKNNLKTKKNNHNNGASRPVPSARRSGRGDSFFDKTTSPASRDSAQDDAGIPTASPGKGAQAPSSPVPLPPSAPATDQDQARAEYRARLLIVMASEMRSYFSGEPVTPLSARESTAFRKAMEGVPVSEVVDCISHWPLALWRRQCVLDYERKKAAGATSYRNLNGFNCKHATTAAKMVDFRDTILPYVTEVSVSAPEDHPAEFYAQRVRELRPIIAREVGYILSSAEKASPEVEARGHAADTEEAEPKLKVGDTKTLANGSSVRFAGYIPPQLDGIPLERWVDVIDKPDPDVARAIDDVEGGYPDPTEPDDMALNEALDKLEAAWRWKNAPDYV
jgi:hypothetical protein